MSAKQILITASIALAVVIATNKVRALKNLVS